MSTIQLSLREIDDWATHRLSAAHADLLAASETVTLRPTGQGTWQIKGAGWVGAAILGDPSGVAVDLRVDPKVPINRLLFLMGYAHDPASWRDDLVDAPAAKGIPIGIAEALARMSDRALRQGVLQGYKTVSEAAMTLRGRIREKDQLQRRFGAAIPVEVVYDEFGPDIPENQIIKAAVWRTLSIPGVTGLTRRRLVRLLPRLVDVTDLPGASRLPQWTPSRLNARYQPALRLAELILKSASFELGRGAVPATGFLVSMPRVFEEFVSAAIGRALTQIQGGRVVAQDADWYLDESRSINLRPDLVWYPSPSRRDGEPGLVIDAKYKAEKFSGFPNADVYQVLAYCSALGLNEGHLIYAKGNEAITTYQLPGTGPQGQGVTVNAHVLDLDLAPTALLDQAAKLATSILSGLSLPAQVR